ncbi:pentatricopeptide repeat-containing protein At1g62350-like isoform X2 [Mangifera indica]|uniref:pentatricopeptide repeat-containing protein At1g62350-like isoform X2 n=1 Tax=Mangifera indica TaxID=29780 RepID=UPI001CFA3F0E|nr:pentatricopeptide repeat-containing protein At1g62350-like isoform X2 [Mangifera indica]
MKSATMGSLKLNFSRAGFHKMPCISLPVNRKIGTLSITCGLRDPFRKPIRQSRVLSTEAIQAVHAMKLAKSNSKLDGVFHGRVSRLLKADLLDTLTELQRQNEVDLALKKEEWYKPDLSLYCDVIQMFGKNELITSAEELFCELQREGLEPDTRAYTEMIGAYLRVGMIDKAMETYGVMKASGCAPDKLTLTILIRNLDNAGEEELAATVRKDCAQYVDYPEKFLETVAKKHRKRVVDIV